MSRHHDQCRRTDRTVGTREPRDANIPLCTYGKMNDMISLNSVPHFPNFRNFTVLDLSWYSEFYKILTPYADLSPGNILIWLDLNRDLSISQINGALTLRYSNPFAENVDTFTILDTALNGGHINEVFAFQRQQGLDIGIFEIPDTFAKSLPSSDFNVQTSRDSWEYILDVSQQVAMHGRKFQRQRTALNNLSRTYSEKQISTLVSTEFDLSVAEAIRFSLNNWQITHNIQENNTNHHNFERVALERVLELGAKSEKQCIKIFLNKQLSALVLFNTYGDTATVGHVKVDYSIDNIFDAAIHFLARHLKSAGVKRMNIEQDLGVPGIRRHKNLMRPISMLKKVNIMPLASHIQGEHFERPCQVAVHGDPVITTERGQKPLR